MSKKAASNSSMASSRPPCGPGQGRAVADRVVGVHEGAPELPGAVDAWIPAGDPDDRDLGRALLSQIAPVHDLPYLWLVSGLKVNSNPTFMTRVSALHRR
jgi:hypothetical protein